MNRKALLVFLLFLLLLLKSNLALPEGGQASNSGQFHGDERHNGFIASVGPTTPLLAWKINQKADGMIASGGRLLVVDDKGIHIINETNGVNSRDIHATIVSNYPVTGMGNIFFIDYEDICFNPYDYIIGENIFR